MSQTVSRRRHERHWVTDRAVHLAETLSSVAWGHQTYGEVKRSPIVILLDFVRPMKLIFNYPAFVFGMDEH